MALCPFILLSLTTQSPDISLATGSEIYSPGTFIVHVNGSIIGITRYATRFVCNFRKLRRAGKVNEFVGVYINHHQKAIHVASDGGRICRPMIIVENGEPRVKTEQIEVETYCVSTRLMTEAELWTRRCLNGAK